MTAFRLAVLPFLLVASAAGQQPNWETIEAVGQPTARHEAALVAYKSKVYLIGGRRVNPVDVFDPATNTWTAKSTTPMELHHFQAVVHGNAIYLMGAMTGGWPKETPLEKVIVYYPEQDRFEYGHTIPEERRRGGAGAVVHNDKIYLVGGITNGHMDGYQPWLDEYDPRTGEWRILDDAPHARDHFQAVAMDGRLYAAAGRTTSHKTGQGFDLTVKAIDVYDFASGKWLPETQCPELPTPRAGNMAFGWNNQLIIGGGESGEKKIAHNEVEAWDSATKKWQTWPALQRGRHGSGFAVVGDSVFTASGSGNRGGGPELTTIERLRLPAKPKSAARASTDSPTRLWHAKTLSFEGPATSETATPNPFTDYRLLVTFTHKQATYTVRGFYAADGNAAETSADAGSIWKVRFSPDQVGTWKYSASLRRGNGIAISNDPQAGEAISVEGATGEIIVADTGDLPSDIARKDFRNRGRLVVSNGRFRFGQGGPHWLKGGTDSPENLLGYEDFDGTFRQANKARDGEAAPPQTLHRYTAHVADWRAGDPVWKDGKGKGLIGAINYLSSTGMNAAYFLTMNIGGDGKDVWPYAQPDDVTRFDCSKLDQWEVVFNHMQRKGVLLHVVLQETENEKLLDDGDTGFQRKLYLNELIARFAHHPALVWNLGEENGPAEFSPNGQNATQQKAMASYLKAADPYKHPVVIHTHSTKQSKDELLPALLGHKPLDGLSFQINDPDHVHSEVIKWKKLSAERGHEWLITMDEIGKWDTGAVPDSVDPEHNNLRHRVLWGSLLAGAAGVEWYFGAHQPHNDLNSEDWRQRANLWQQTAHAVSFFETFLPYGEMEPGDELVSPDGCYCFAKAAESYAIYVPAAENEQSTRHVRLDLKSFNGPFTVQWFNPRTGGDLQSGSVTHITDSGQVELGQPPSAPGADWVILVRSK